MSNLLKKEKEKNEKPNKSKKAPLPEGPNLQSREIAVSQSHHFPVKVHTNSIFSLVSDITKTCQRILQKDHELGLVADSLL